jgi:transcriptional regulator with XRE-family HTH domain
MLMTEEFNKIKVNIGKEMRSFRDIFNINQVEMAKKLGLGRTTISNIERVKSEDPGDSKVTKLLAISTAFIFKNENRKLKEKIKKIDFSKLENKKKELVIDLKKINIDENTFNKNLEKYTKDLYPKKNKQQKDMFYYMINFQINNLFSDPENNDLPNEYLDVDLFKKIIKSIVNYYEFKLKKVYLNENEKFDINKKYNFDPYQFLNKNP